MPRPSLLDTLAEQRDSFVHVKRKAPWINLRVKGAERFHQRTLEDVGTDYILVGVGDEKIAKPIAVDRKLIEEVQFLGEAN